MRGAEGVGKFATARLRHDQIGQKKIDFASAIFGEQASRIVAIGGFDHFVTETAQHADGNVTNADVVFENENCFRAAAWLFAARLFVGRRRRSWNTREVNSHGRAFPIFAFDPQMSSALVHDAVTSGEAETASLFIGLGGEERFEEMC